MIKMLCDRGVLVYTWLECPKTELDFVHTHCEKFTPFIDCGSGVGHQDWKFFSCAKVASFSTAREGKSFWFDAPFDFRSGTSLIFYFPNIRWECGGFFTFSMFQCVFMLIISFLECSFCQSKICFHGFVLDMNISLLNQGCFLAFSTYWAIHLVSAIATFFTLIIFSKLPGIVLFNVVF